MIYRIQVVRRKVKRTCLNRIGSCDQKPVVAVIILNLDPLHLCEVSAVVHCHEREEEFAYCILIDSLSCIGGSVVECLDRSVAVPCHILKSCREGHHGAYSQECSHSALRSVYFHVDCDLSVAVDRISHNHRSIACVWKRQVRRDHRLSALVFGSLDALYIDRISSALPSCVKRSPVSCVVVILNTASPEVRGRSLFHKHFALECVVFHCTCRSVDQEAEVFSDNLIRTVFLCYDNILVADLRSALLYCSRNRDLNPGHLSACIRPVFRFLQRHRNIQVILAACLGVLRHIERNFERSCRLRSNVHV